ncbi:flagellar MS-ring protein [Kluyvera cryocrescens]|uniref:Flagellar MS-ring protein n=1 Tax=Kluyvera cryocrescens TaxID=580 RepID=A0A485AJD4_KLUCR|nr:flagellar MS-ring protein [Kluyvera cryocrescens]
MWRCTARRESIPVSQVVEVLGAENIAYRINPDNGQVLVTENKLSAGAHGAGGERHYRSDA